MSLSIVCQTMGNDFCSITFSPDSQNFLVAQLENIFIYGSEDFEHQQTLQGHKSWIWTLCFSPSGNLLASGSNDKHIIIWDFHSKAIKQRLTYHQDPVFTLSFSQDEAYLASGSRDNLVIIYDLHKQQINKKIDQFQNRIKSVTYSQDGKYLIVGEQEKKIKILGTDDYNLIQKLDHRINQFQSVQITSDGKTLATAYQGQIKIYNAQNFKIIKTIFQLDKSIDTNISFSSDNQKLIVTNCSKKETTIEQIRIQDYSIDQQKYKFAGDLSQSAFSSDGKYWATLFDDRFIVYDWNQQILIKNNQQENSSGSASDVILCVICFNKERRLLFSPCKHCVSCLECYNNIIKKQEKQVCPICKTNIQNITEIFL